MVIVIEVDVKNANLTFLDGLNILDKFKTAVNNVHNVLDCHSVGDGDPLVRKNEHIYLEWQKKHNMLYTYAELGKLHRNILHPSFDILLNLLKLARPWKTDTGTMKILEDIDCRCDACQRLSRGLVHC